MVHFERVKVKMFLCAELRVYLPKSGDSLSVCVRPSMAKSSLSTGQNKFSS